MKQKYIASVSWGKDSTAMLLNLIQLNYSLDEVVFYDTGMEFQAIYDTRNKFLPILAKLSIKYTELKPSQSFVYQMLGRKVHKRDGTIGHGYSWCGGRCRWGTTEKLKALDKYAESQNAIVYVGIAVDETKRIEKDRKIYKRLPLVWWQMTEEDCLKLCYQHSFEWKENGVKLYDILDRVSCWCCANKNLKELKNIYIYLPDYWERLKTLQSQTNRPMKGFYKDKPKGIFELEERFKHETLNQKKKAPTDGNL